MPTSTRQHAKAKIVSPTHGRKSMLSLHGASVAFAPARSLTSHARRVYASRYRGRYRFSGWVFGFDVFLLGVLVTLIVFDLAVLLTTTVPPDGGVSLTFTSAPLSASEDIPIIATVRANDLAAHEDVRLQWRVPDWVEIIRAEPAIDADGAVYFGPVSPGIEHRSLIVVRIRAVKGVSVPFDLTLHQTDRFGFRQTTTGREIRQVVSSVVSVDTLAPFTMASPGASIPVVVRNTGKSSLESAVFRLTQGSGTVAGGSSFFLGHLAPSSTRIVFIDLPQQSGGTDATLAWQVEDRARIVAASSTVLTMSTLPFPLEIRPAPTSDLKRRMLHIGYALSSGSSGKILAILDGGVASALIPAIDAVDGTHAVDVPIAPDATEIFTRWSLVPVVTGPDGGWWVSARLSRGFTSALPFSAAARYYSDTGDQIGVGPISPLVDQETRYWIVWSVDPGTSGLKDVTLTGALPSDVRATGNFASTVSGSFSANGRSVTWTIPTIPPRTGQTPVTFAFEAILTPSVTRERHPLFATSTVEALDAASGATLYAEAAGDDSRWLHDEKARSKK